DGGTQSRPRHQVHHIRAGIAIEVAVGDPADAALGVPAELCEFRQPTKKPVAVHGRWRVFHGLTASQKCRRPARVGSWPGKARASYRFTSGEPGSPGLDRHTRDGDRLEVL